MLVFKIEASNMPAKGLCLSMKRAICPLKATEYKMRHIHKPCEAALRIDPLGYLKIRLVGVRSSPTSF